MVVAVTPTAILSTRRNTQPKVSVAVSTYDRPQLLRRLMDALEKQTVSKEDYEVIVVDNGSGPATAAVLRGLERRTELQIHAMRIEPNQGPGGGRNAAWRAARAEIVAFTDDDCAPTPAWLEQGLRTMRSGDRVVVGRTLPDPDLPIGPFSRTIHVYDVNWLPTCNVFYRRSDLDEVNGFDEGFRDPGGEDTDLAFRVRQRCGREFAFAHESLVYHDVRQSRFLDAARETARWTDLPRFFELHPEGRSALHRRIFWKPSHPKAILALAGLILGSRRRAFLSLALPWLYYRTRVRRPLGWPKGAYRALPGIFIIDVLEVVAMIRGSLRRRTLVL